MQVIFKTISFFGFISLLVYSCDTFSDKPIYDATQTPTDENFRACYIIIQDTIDVKPAILWTQIIDFGNLNDLMPDFVSKSELFGQYESAVRTLTFKKDGGKMIEKCLVLNGEDLLFQYKLLSSSYPIYHYLANMDINENEDGTSALSWRIIFDVSDENRDEMEKMITDFIESGIEGYKRSTRNL